MAKMDIAPADRWRVKLECLRLLATFRLDPAQMRLVSGFVDTYLQLSADENADFLKAVEDEGFEEREAYMEIVTSWMREVIKRGPTEGLQPGLQKGLQQGKEQLVVRILTHRFETLSETKLARVRGLSEFQLGDLAEAVFDFTRPSDLDNWLASRTT